MPIARSRVTAQGQISVPSQVRKKLGVGPGSVIEWEEQGAKLVVRRAGRYSSQDIHNAIFGKRTPKPRTLDEIKRGLKDHFKAKYARR
jgi:AbrB family looped-hinge helix DNA binding protein